MMRELAAKRKRETCLVMFSECDRHYGCSAP
jgi:hypothetical protein